ncbi:TatD family hydrolase [Kiritimatiellaeota bacterium B1221]|nr:TatD family hydrolase [Kiritimatiellaeota bacterium B1221]
MYFDSHFHLDHFAQKDCIPEMLQSAKEADVTKMLAIGGSDEANQLAFKTAKTYPDQLWCSAGYDRDLAPDWDGDLSRLRPLLAEEKVVAVGECGIDYFHNIGTPKEQKRLFGSMLELACEFKKPVVVHSREADDDSLDMLAELSRNWPDTSRCCAVLHCFTGDVTFAKKLLDLNLMISFSGIVSFNNAASIREVAAIVPDERILIETDSPYLAPVPHRGKQNEPAFVPHVAEVLAKVRECSPEEIGQRSTENARHFLSI